LPQLADRSHRRTEPDQDVTWAQQAIDGLLALQDAADAAPALDQDCSVLLAIRFRPARGTVLLCRCIAKVR
jgi:hypothetical protein